VPSLQNCLDDIRREQQRQPQQAVDEGACGALGFRDFTAPELLELGRCLARERYKLRYDKSYSWLFLRWTRFQPCTLWSPKKSKELSPDSRASASRRRARRRIRPWEVCKKSGYAAISEC
jgi:hypothetical protein